MDGRLREMKAMHINSRRLFQQVEQDTDTVGVRGSYQMGDVCWKNI